MSSKYYVINDLEDFTKESRTMVFNNFGKWDDAGVDKSDLSVILGEDEQEELDELLTQNESLLIVKEGLIKQRNKKTKENRYILTNKRFVKILNDLNARMVSNSFNVSVKRGLLESAFDNNLNDFVFWEKDNEQEASETD